MQLTDQEIIQEAKNRYGITSELKVITEGFQNMVYRYTQNNNEYILRITPAPKKNESQLKGEILWVNFLADNGVSVSRGILSPKSKLVETVQVKKEIYFLTSFAKAEGSPVIVTDERIWNANLFKEWGRLLGKVHRFGKPFGVQGNTLNRPMWEVSHPYIHEIFLHIPQKWLKEKYDAIVDQLKTCSTDKNHFGLIHNDFHQGNFFVEDRKITLFDFDDCAYFWFAYDIATSFYHAYWQHSSFNGQDDQFTMDFLKNILTGYAEENTVTSEIIDQLPLFLKLREMFLYLLFLEKWDQTSLEGWQEYTLSSLKHAIEKDTVYAGLTGDRLIKLKQYIRPS
jgi:amicoumacin kinase